jgi:outer membrane protein/protease secretion system outer membrane protein
MKHAVRSRSAWVRTLVGGAILAGVTHVAPALAIDLLRSYELAVINDGQLKVSKARVEQGREVLPQAKAQLWPNIGFSYSYGQVDQTRTLNNLSESLNYPSWSASIQLRQPLYRKYLFSQVDQAKWQVEGTEAQLDMDIQAMGTRVVAAYFDALFSRDSLDLILTQLASYQAQLRAAKLAFAAGTGTRTDIDDIQARYDLLRAEEIKARQSIGSTTLQLEIYVGERIRALASLNEQRFQPDELDPKSPEMWVPRALAYNPGVRQLAARYEAARAGVEMAQSGHLPTLDLVASSGESTGEQTGTLPRTDYRTNYIGVQVNFPIFAGGYVSSQVRQAIAAADEAREALDYAKDDLTLQVRRTFDALKAGISRVRALEVALVSADQMVLSNEKGVRAGTRTTIDVLAAEQQRFNARVELAKERYQMLVNYAALLGFVGDLNAESVGRINKMLKGQAG